MIARLLPRNRPLLLLCVGPFDRQAVGFPSLNNATRALGLGSVLVPPQSRYRPSLSALAEGIGSLLRRWPLLTGRTLLTFAPGVTAAVGAASTVFTSSSVW
jgi:hypothetical protein